MALPELMERSAGPPFAEHSSFWPYEERTHWLVWLKLDPRWENLRSDARFEHLMQRVGLAP